MSKNRSDSHFASGSLSVEIQTTLAVSQPNPLSPRDHRRRRKTTGVKEEAAQRVSGKTEPRWKNWCARRRSASTPRIIAILQSLKTAGALEAELEVI
jgi:flagellar basal body P-ring protein FlgI